MPDKMVMYGKYFLSFTRTNELDVLYELYHNLLRLNFDYIIIVPIVYRLVPYNITTSIHKNYNGNIEKKNILKSLSNCIEELTQ